MSNTLTGVNTGSQKFFMAVDTCENFREFTGNNNCKSNEEVEPYISTLLVHTRVFNEYFSASTYAENNEHLSSKFDTFSYPLTSLQVSSKILSIIPNHIEFNKAWFYTDQLIGHYSEFKTYETTATDYWSFPAAQRQNL